MRRLQGTGRFPWKFNAIVYLQNVIYVTCSKCTLHRTSSSRRGHMSHDLQWSPGSSGVTVALQCRFSIQSQDDNSHSAYIYVFVYRPTGIYLVHKFSYLSSPLAYFCKYFRFNCFEKNVDMPSLRLFWVVFVTGICQLYTHLTHPWCHR